MSVSIYISVEPDRVDARRQTSADGSVQVRRAPHPPCSALLASVIMCIGTSNVGRTKWHLPGPHGNSWTCDEVVRIGRGRRTKHHTREEVKKLADHAQCQTTSHGRRRQHASRPGSDGVPSTVSLSLASHHGWLEPLWSLANHAAETRRRGANGSARRTTASGSRTLSAGSTNFDPRHSSWPPRDREWLTAAFGPGGRPTALRRLGSEALPAATLPDERRGRLVPAHHAARIPPRPGGELTPRVMLSPDHCRGSETAVVLAGPVPFLAPVLDALSSSSTA